MLMKNATPRYRPLRFGVTRAVLREAGQAMGGYVRGAAINALAMGTLAYIALTLLGVNYALALSILTMLAEPIPIIGPIVAAVPVVAVALLQSPELALMALGVYVVLQQLESQLLTPNIMRSQTDMPHATMSLWEFQVISPHEQDVTLVFTAKAELVKGEGEVRRAERA